MAVDDDWGRDPSVQMMRQVFSRMEVVQEEFLKHLNIAPLDARLRHWRETALGCFERAWVYATRRAIHFEEEKAAAVYIHCLARGMALEGINIPPGALPQDQDIEMLLTEALR